MARRSTRFCQFGVLLFLCLRFGGSPAADLRVPSQDEALSLLFGNQFAELDSRYGAIQSAYKAGNISDEDLRAAFRVFYSTDPKLHAHYAAWTKQSPKSYSAHLARGLYFKKLGQEALGGELFEETSGEERAGIEEVFRLSQEELNASLSLDDKPTLSYLHLINISQFLRNHKEADILIRRAIASDPRSYIVRENYMIAIETQNGGSHEKMKDFLTESRRAGLSTEHVNALEALVLEDEAWIHRNVDGDTDAAILAYKKAAELNPEASCRPCGPVMQSAELLLENKNYAGAAEQYSKVIAFDPSYLAARNGRAFAQLQMQQPTLAVDEFTYSASRGDAYAQDMLGRMYLLGTSIPKDHDKAVEWLKKAAAQGYEPAVRILPFALDKTATPLPFPGGPRL